MFRTILKSCMILCVLGGALSAQDQPEGKKPVKPQTKKQAKQGQDLKGWTKLLVKRLRAKNPRIARSAEAAIVALGGSALPHLRRLSKGGQETPVVQRLIRRIEQATRRSRGRQPQQEGQQPRRRRQAQGGEQPRSGEQVQGSEQPRSGEQAQRGQQPRRRRQAQSDEQPGRGRQPAAGQGARRGQQGSRQGFEKQFAALVKQLNLDEPTASQLRKATERLAARRKELGSLMREGEMKREQLKSESAAAMKDFRSEVVACLGEENARIALRRLRAVGGRSGRSRGADARRGRSRGEGERPSRPRRNKQT